MPENLPPSGHAAEILNLQKVARGLYKSGLFPGARSEYGAFAIVEYGRELGIPPLLSLKNINIIDGQLACNAQLILALARQKGVTYTVARETDSGAAIIFRRGEDSYEASFDESDARAAGLLARSPWQQYPGDMYFWRAVAKGVRRIAPDAVMGLYTADEIESGRPVREKQPAKARPRPAGAPPEETRFISRAQARRLYALARRCRWPVQELKLYLAGNHGLEHISEIPRDSYGEICRHLEDNPRPGA